MIPRPEDIAAGRRRERDRLILCAAALLGPLAAVMVADVLFPALVALQIGGAL